MQIRRYQPGEEETLRKIFVETTRKVNGFFYTPEQIERWTSRHSDPELWEKRIRDRNPFVAEHEGQLLGFAELEGDGHIDFFYCHHEHQRQGVGSALMRAIFAEAIRLGLTRLYASVSAAAVEFFLANGFTIDEQRDNLVCGQPARQYMMSKDEVT